MMPMPVLLSWAGSSASRLEVAVDDVQINPYPCLFDFELSLVLDSGVGAAMVVAARARTVK